MQQPATGADSATVFDCPARGYGRPNIRAHPRTDLGATNLGANRGPNDRSNFRSPRATHTSTNRRSREASRRPCPAEAEWPRSAAGLQLSIGSAD